MDEQQQADRLRTAFALATRFGWIENLTWYEYRDSCTHGQDPECNFGLVHTDLAQAVVRRPARGDRGRHGQVAREGIFWARFEGPDLRSGTLEARYPGSDAYQPLTTQIQVVSSVTTSR
jgi:hypothetical protein